jgi:hypothetical protein
LGEQEGAILFFRKIHPQFRIDIHHIGQPRRVDAVEQVDPAWIIVPVQINEVNMISFGFEFEPAGLIHFNDLYEGIVLF